MGFINDIIRKPVCLMVTIEVAPITHVRNKNSNIQGRSSDLVKLFSIPKGAALKGKKSLPLGANSLL